MYSPLSPSCKNLISSVPRSRLAGGARLLGRAHPGDRHIATNHEKYSLIKDVSNNSSLGYDIQSINPNGNLKFIEVKTEGFDNSFIISRNEITRLNETENYYIYVVNHNNSFSEIKELDLNRIELEDKRSINGIEFYPINFRVHF